MSTDVLSPLRETQEPLVVAAATLRLVRSPVRAADGSLRLLCREVRVGQTVAAALPTEHAWARVIWNGRVLTPDEQQQQLVHPGDEITAFPAWGIEASLGTALIMIAIGLAVSIASAALSYVLFPPKKPNAIEPQFDEPTESFEGIRTTVGPGAVIPVIYGRRRIGGQLLSAKVVQALTIIDDNVPGSALPHAITDVTGGLRWPDGTPNDEIVVTAPNHGASTGSHVDIGGVLGKTGANGGWFVKILDVHRVQLLGSRGIDPTPYAGGGVLVLVDEAAPGTRRVDAISTPPTLTMLFAIGEGPIGGVLWDTMEINGQPLGNFPTVRVFQQLGTATQLPLPEFGEIANTFADGRDIPDTGSLLYTTTVPVQAFVLNIAFNQGLYFMSTRGEKQENISTIGYRYRVSPAGAWSAFAFFDVAASRTAPVRFGIRRQGLPLATYDIELVWSHAFHVDDGRAQWVGTLDSITEIQSNTNAYVNTATFGIEAVPTDSLQGALPNITVEVLGRAVRVGEFVQNHNYTEDPAWAVMDLMTNTRYGMKIPDSEINLPAFIAWSAYNNEIISGEKRHTINYILDREQRAQAAILEICGGSRTLLFKSEGQWVPRPTRNTSPSQLFSWANVSNLKLTYTKDPDHINVMEARFTNEEQDFEQDVLTWPTIANWPVTVHKASTDLRGVTKPSRVMRALQFELNRRRFELLSMECDAALDAMVLQPHDIFRFSHPMPGWGTSGRVRPGSTVNTLFLDTPVTFQTGIAYHMYLRFDFDATDLKAVINPGAGTYHAVTFTTPLAQFPDPDVTLWAFGESSPIDTAVKLFRAVRIQRKSDTTVHIQAIAHNPSIYDEATATALPVVSSLFNPAGVPPPLVSLVATEVVRIQTSGASVRVANLSWDVANLSAGYAPYGGAAIFRRSVLVSGQMGQATAGVVDLGAIQDPSDPNVNFAPLVTLRGHVLDYDDYTTVSGSTYVYRVVPLSGQGVPNNVGAREALLHIAGPTTSGFFPGTPQRLRLRGQAVGVTTFEGRDIHIEWDSVANSPLFSTTFFVVTYTIEMWAPGQLYLMRRTIVPAGAPEQTLQFTYTYEQNVEDNVRAGMNGAQRSVLFQVFANANTGVSSLVPATMTVSNPPPDMSEILPQATPLFEAAIINFQQWVEPRDFSHYTVYLDTVNPPLAIYQDLGVAFQQLAPMGLPANVTQYVYIQPHDTFGVGISSQIASFTPVALTADFLDEVPPDTPTGLTLTTGTDVSDDGTIMSWVRASWTLAPEADVAGYEVHVFIGAGTVPTVYNPKRTQNSIQIPVPGNITIRVKLLAFDRFHNVSDFTAESSIVSAGDTVPPAAPTGLVAIGSIRSINLLWAPPSDPDYAYAEVWSHTANNRASAIKIGQGAFSFHHDGLGANDARFYWIRSVDTSGNFSTDYFPVSATAGIAGTAGQLDSTFISNLAADKITAGIITALVRVGVNNIVLDGVASQINIFDNQIPGVARVVMGRLGALSTQWGLQLFGPSGNLMWNFATGATTDGISDSSITATKISAATITSTHLRTDTAVITTAAQIANALINNAHIGNAAIQNANIGDAQIDAAKIIDASITNAKIQDLAVSTAKIDALAVTDAKIATLTANKITAGSLTATYSIGVGNFIDLDGPNHLITIRDAASTVRVFLGQVTGSYGLQVFNAAGQIMWDFTTGAQTRGIAVNAVTSVVANDVSGEFIVGTTETWVASVTFSQLVLGDLVILHATAIGNITNNTMTLRLRQGSPSGVTGTVITVMNLTFGATGAGKMPATIHAMYGAPGTENNKQFFVTLQSDTGNVSTQDLSFTAVQYKR